CCWYAAPHQVDVADLLQSWTRNDDRRARYELAHILHRVPVEIDLVGNSKPHMGLGPPSHTLDVEVVIDIDVVGRAVAAAGAAAEGERWREVVVDSSHCSHGARRVHQDASRIHH